MPPVHVGEEASLESAPVASAATSKPNGAGSCNALMAGAMRQAGLARVGRFEASVRTNRADQVLASFTQQRRACFRHLGLLASDHDARRGCAWDRPRVSLLIVA
jgi:hypothetical protein